MTQEAVDFTCRFSFHSPQRLSLFLYFFSSDHPGGGVQDSEPQETSQGTPTRWPQVLPSFHLLGCSLSLSLDCKPGKPNETVMILGEASTNSRELGGWCGTHMSSDEWYQIHARATTEIQPMLRSRASRTEVSHGDSGQQLKKGMQVQGGSAGRGNYKGSTGGAPSQRISWLLLLCFLHLHSVLLEPTQIAGS